MALALLSPPLHHPLRPLNPPPLACTTASSTGFSFFFPPAPRWRASSAAAGDGPGPSEAAGDTPLDADLLRRVSAAADADQALDIVAESLGGAGSGPKSSLDASDCNAIVAAALDRGNVDLALSVFEAMRSGLARVGRWSWARPDVRTYALLVQRLAAALRVSDAIRIVGYVSRAGASSAEEVRFGITVCCPTCMVAIAVAQPQHGTQVVSCSKCRYQYELLSGDITNIESEEVSMDTSAFEKALQFINVMKDDLPAAVHSIVIRTPSGTARTHRFATKTVELPAQGGERVTISLAAPANVYREMGPLKIAARSKGFSPGEPMCLTNHVSGQVSKLLRPPSKNVGPFVLTPYLFVGALALLASGDAVSAFIDPSLPRLITATAIASAAVGTTLNQVILPETRKLCSMIEIEVEMDSDVLVAEAATGAERISEQIQQLMEIDSLEEQWRIQAEANDEAERLLSSDSSEALSAEHV
ncbi:uncharacterized protein [Lolium perenne]|uniref:uncharacterized protein isoform X2 n=1 Tax=Lolium perenne TaxID=4522 RepID=UPI0021F688EA|nr:uncharacterized protein LOC127313574 isoform X2 [Lolium perenne]